MGISHTWALIDLTGNRATVGANRFDMQSPSCGRESIWRGIAQLWAPVDSESEECVKWNVACIKALGSVCVCGGVRAPVITNTSPPCHTHFSICCIFSILNVPSFSSCLDDAYDLYSGCAWFEFRPGFYRSSVTAVYLQILSGSLLASSSLIVKAIANSSILC